MYNIGIIGKKRSGKDTAADYLVRVHAYTKLAFADPLKEMALRVDPWITYEHGDGDWLSGIGAMRLSEVVTRIGWDRAKEEHPEVRRTLQNLGQAQREYDEDYWVNAMRRKLNGAESWNMPVVVSDVRYRNEALMLRSRGFRLVRIVRPAPAAHSLTGAGATSARHLADATAAHTSETELDDFHADMEISNSGTLEDLHRMVGMTI